MIVLKETLAPEEHWHKNTQQHRYVKIFTLEAVLENSSTVGVLESLFHCVLMNIELKICQTLDDARVVIAEQTSINLFFYKMMQRRAYATKDVFLFSKSVDIKGDLTKG